MPIYLRALALQYYRGVGPKIQKLSPFQEFNFFIGANNAGKSTILDYLRRHLNHEQNPQQDLPLEQYRGEASGNTSAAIGIPYDEFLRNVYTSLGDRARNGLITDNVPKLCELVAESGVIWLRHPFSDARKPTYYLGQPSLASFRAVITDQILYQVWGLITGRSGGALEQAWIPQTLNSFLEAQSSSLRFPDVKLIPAIQGYWA